MKKHLLFTLFAFLASISMIKAQGDELYSQMGDSYSIYDYVYSFEYTGYAPYDTYGADDFEVPTGETWDIFSVKSIMKSYSNVTTMNVIIMEDDNGSPGTELYHFSDIANNEVTDLPEYMTYEIKTYLPSTVSLSGGIYWISISADGQDTWQWLYQTTTTTNLSQTHVINPGGEMGFPTEWTVNANYSGYYNVSFALFAPPAADDLTISEITSPVSGELTDAEIIEVIIVNVGSEEQTSFDVQYQIDGGTAVVETVSTSIAPNQTYTHTFGTTEDMSALGDYTVDVAVNLAGDANNDNDSLQIIVTNYGAIYELNSSSTSETTCSGLFTDAGGLFNGFGSDDGGTITFYPETTGSRVVLDFEEFDLGSNEQQFIIYDGENTSGNILYIYKEEWHGYGEHNDPPDYVRARNSDGTVTIELIPYAYMYEDAPGWIAELDCMIPEDIDFTVLDLQLEEGFLHLNMPTIVTTRIVNSGATSQSRTVNLVEEGVIVETITSNMLNPSDVQEIDFTWLPQAIGDSISLIVEIEDDPNETNDDNSIETIVEVFSQYALIESFEAEGLIPEYWDVKKGDFEKKIMVPIMVRIT